MMRDLPARILRALPRPAWHLHGVALYHGDARELLARLPERSIDFVITDPPYGHKNNNGDLIHRREIALGEKECRCEHHARPIANDGPEANELVQALFREAARVLRCGCCCCCGGGGGGPDPQFARWALWMEQHMRFKQMVVWDKGPMGLGWHYRRSYETVLVAQKGEGKCRWYDTTRRIENVIRGIRKIIPRADQHPTEKPVELFEYFIRLHSRRGHILADPFTGGASGLVAALALGRRAIGFEIDAHWIEYAQSRLNSTLEDLRR